MELVGPDYRSLVTLMACIFFASGMMLLAGITYLIRDWIIMGLLSTIPFLVFFGYVFVLPESPRWLLTQGRMEEALKVLEMMARVNKRELPASFRSELEAKVKLNKTQKQKKPKTFGALDLCRLENRF